MINMHRIVITYTVNFNQLSRGKFAKLSVSAKALVSPHLYLGIVLTFMTLALPAKMTHTYLIPSLFRYVHIYVMLRVLIIVSHVNIVVSQLLILA